MAVATSAAHRDAEAKRLTVLRDDLIRQVLAAVPDAYGTALGPVPARVIWRAAATASPPLYPDGVTQLAEHVPAVNVRRHTSVAPR